VNALEPKQCEERKWCYRIHGPHRCLGDEGHRGKHVFIGCEWCDKQPEKQS
jgi:hypothetical protein